jgi:hypothetical protein
LRARLGIGTRYSQLLPSEPRPQGSVSRRALFQHPLQLSAFSPQPSAFGDQLSAFQAAGFIRTMSEEFEKLMRWY